MRPIFTSLATGCAVTSSLHLAFLYMAVSRVVARNREIPRPHLLEADL